MVTTADPGERGSFTLFGIHFGGHLFVGWHGGATVASNVGPAVLRRT